MIEGWKQEQETEYLTFLQESPRATPRDVAVRFGVSECCAVYWLTELARAGRVRIQAVELVPPGEAPCDRQSFLTCQRKQTCPIESIAGDPGGGEGRA